MIDDKLRTELRLQRAMLTYLIATVDATSLTVDGLALDIQTLSGNTKAGDERMAKKLAEYVKELQDGIARTTADVAAQTTLIGSVKAVVVGGVAQVAALRVQVEELLAGGGDPAVLQPVIDAIAATERAMQENTAGLVEAVLQGTPADPGTGGGPGPAGTTPEPGTPGTPGTPTPAPGTGGPQTFTQ